MTSSPVTWIRSCFLHHYSFEIAQIEVFGFEHADIRCAVGYQIYPICLTFSKIASLGGQGDFLPLPPALPLTRSLPYFRFVFLENQHIKMADRDSAPVAWTVARVTGNDGMQKVEYDTVAVSSRSGKRTRRHPCRRR